MSGIGDAKSAKIPGVASDGQFWVCRTLSTITKMEGLKKYVKPSHAFDEENKQVLASANETLVMLQKVIQDFMLPTISKFASRNRRIK